MSVSVADLCTDLPIVTFEPGDVLMSEGDRSGRIYVLVEGVVEVLKGDFQINVVSDRGAVFGEMSILQDLPHMATVRAVTECRLRVTTDGEDFLRSHPDIAYLIAQMLAQRLHGVTTYLVDLKRQFEGESSHLGVVDEILESLTHQQRTRFTPGSDREPDY